METADFGGWATKAGLKCSDGRVIMRGAFEHMDQQQVPLVWQHGHHSAENVLGHAILETRDEGVYAYAFFNDTKQGQNAKELVQHGDIKHLSIYANNLVEKGKNVIHGMIREVSLVLAGANPGAVIDYVRLAHSDGSYDDLEDEAVITTGIEIEKADEYALEHADSESNDGDDGDDGELTVQDVYDTLDEQQKNVVHYLIGVALEAAIASGAESEKKSAQHSDDETSLKTTDPEGGDAMSRNVFDQSDAIRKGGSGSLKHKLTEDDMKAIVADAMKVGSLKEAVNNYALQHGITSVETLFPDAKSLTNTPEFNKRQTEWVPKVLDSVRRSPFSRVKTLMADITMDEARAKGYIKGNFKKEEWFGVTKRTTTPTTIYKKQQLDRDDVVDITDFDVVAWIRGEMRMMLEEEIARAILIGDGRDVSSEDKIKDPMAAADGSGIRSILNEHELYATTVNVNLGSPADYLNVVEEILRARRFYKGTGTPTLYTTNQTVVEMLLTKDEMGRRYWNTKQELASALMVNDIVEVEVMEEEPDLLGIIVNLADYNVGADKGGEVSLFDDFDIDYNQYKYLIETRISGALVKLKSALVIKKAANTGVVVTPGSPTFNETTYVVTIPKKTGVVYKNNSTSEVLNPGPQDALGENETLTVKAVPASGFDFPVGVTTEWAFEGPTGG